MKETTNIILLFVFVLISILFIDAPVADDRLQAHSSTLEKTIEHTDNGERIIYRDFNGNITFASDEGFAIKTNTATQSGVLEEFFDENGMPINRSLGYHAVLQEYQENGQKTRTTYLGFDYHPINILQGYAIVKYTYGESQKTVIETYFDTQNVPVCSRDYGYSKKSEYKDGKVIKITFLDRVGNPMVTGLGYAMLTRIYYQYGVEKGKIKEEFYFDENGDPKAIGLGQYGIHIGYNKIGQQTVLTYLDAEGQPIINTKGYSKVVRTFNDDNTIATELYYDTEGIPISRMEGQFGEKKEDGKEVYLNADGSEQFNIKRLLFNNSYLVIAFSVLIVIISSLINRKYNILLMILYILAIIYITLLFRERKAMNIYIEPFQSYKHLLTDSGARSGVIRNIWLFIPLGAILFRIYPSKWILIITVLLSVSIESVQYFMKIGYCELDDVISNGLGGLIGYKSVQIILKMLNKHSEK